MTTLDYFLIPAFTPVMFGLWVFINNGKACFFTAIFLHIVVLGSFAAAYVIPHATADWRRDREAAARYAQKNAEPMRRQAALDNGPVLFRQYLGSDRTTEDIVRALQTTRRQLLKEGVKGSERQFREYVQQYPFGLRWKDEQWVFKTGKQWKWGDVN